VIPPDILFLALAGIAFLGFLLDATFHRLRVASILPLMLLGVALVASGLIPASTIGLLNSLIPYVSAITVAFILFAVGLEIRFADLFRVLGRATSFTLVVQLSTGVALSLLAYSALHWSLLISFVFGFALSGPSSIAVPVLVRVARLPESLRTSLLFESVVSDVLQLLVPILMIGFLVAGHVTAGAVVSSLLWTVLGSAGGGIAAALAWLWLLDRLRAYSEGYTWTLTITMVLATYGTADRLGMSAAIAVFVFGLTLGNAALLDFRRSREHLLPSAWLSARLQVLRERMGLSTRGLDIPHILQVQKEVSFFASAFFFVYIGLLFQTTALTADLVLVAVVGSLLMLGLRFAFSPILAGYLEGGPAARRSQLGLLGFNVSRGLAAAVVATIPQGMGIVIPGFLDAVFLGILFSTVVSTVGIFALYRPEAGETTALPPGAGLSSPSLEYFLEPHPPAPAVPTVTEPPPPPPLPTGSRSPGPAGPGGAFEGPGGAVELTPSGPPPSRAPSGGSAGGPPLPRRRTSKNASVSADDLDPPAPP
jgi:NhaP-type Na+/H+ or K+/H+ antiporter